jgi:hypothetical protein
MKTYTLYKSTNPNKKYDVYVINPQTGNIKKVSFGAYGYSDYTIHKDKDRRNRYRIRHQHDKIYDITKSGFWSWWILWNKPNVAESLKYIKTRFKLKSTLV